MPTPRKTDVLTELLTEKELVALIVGLKAFAAKDPHAKIAHADCTHALGLFHGEIKAVVEGKVELVAHPAVDLHGLKRNAIDASRLLASAMQRHDRGADVTRIRKDNPDPIVAATELMRCAGKINVKSVAALFEEAKAELKAYDDAKERVGGGGHPIFEDKIARTATKIWLAYDAGMDIYGICLRKAGKLYDETWATRSRVKTSLRPTLLERDPASPPAAPVKKPKKVGGTPPGTGGGTPPAT